MRIKQKIVTKPRKNVLITTFNTHVFTIPDLRNSTTSAREAKLFQRHFIKGKNRIIPRNHKGKIQTQPNTADVATGPDNMEGSCSNTPYKPPMKKRSQKRMSRKKQQTSEKDMHKNKGKVLTKRVKFTKEQLAVAAAREKVRTQERLHERKAKQCRAAISKKSRIFGSPKTPGNYNKMKRQKVYKIQCNRTTLLKKSLISLTCALPEQLELRKYIAIPKSKEAEMSHKELCEHLKKGAKELSKQALRKSTVSNNMNLIKKFNELMDKLGKKRAPTPHRALMFFTHLRNSGYSVSYISKSLTCLKNHPNLEEDYEDIATHPDVRVALANLRRNTLQSEDSRVPLTLNCMQQFEELIDQFTPKAALTMKTALWLGVTCMLRLGKLCTTTRH